MHFSKTRILKKSSSAPALFCRTAETNVDNIIAHKKKKIESNIQQVNTNISNNNNNEEMTITVKPLMNKTFYLDLQICSENQINQLKQEIIYFGGVRTIFFIL